MTSKEEKKEKEKRREEGKKTCFPISLLSKETPSLSISFYLCLSYYPLAVVKKDLSGTPKIGKGLSAERERVGRGCEQCSGREEWLEYLEIVTRKKEKQSAEKGGGEGGGAGLVVLNGY